MSERASNGGRDKCGNKVEFSVGICQPGNTDASSCPLPCFFFLFSFFGDDFFFFLVKKSFFVEFLN